MRPSQMARLRDTGEDFFPRDQSFRLEVPGLLGHSDMASTRIYAPLVNAKHVQR